MDYVHVINMERAHACYIVRKCLRGRGYISATGVAAIENIENSNRCHILEIIGRVDRGTMGNTDGIFSSSQEYQCLRML